MLYNRGYGSVEFRSIEQVLTLAFSTDPAMTPPPPPSVSRTIVPPSAAGATRVDLTLHAAGDGLGRSLEFQINGFPYPKATPYRAALGETQLWVIKNDTKWDHPFHLHGYFFMPVTRRANRCARWRGRTPSTSR
jgi:FtsP/CotA-like multicopper oxidase with cupredoxin domain